VNQQFPAPSLVTRRSGDIPNQQFNGLATRHERLAWGHREATFQPVLLKEVDEVHV